MRRVRVLAAALGCAVTVLVGFAAGRFYLSNGSAPSSTGQGAQTELTTGTVASRWPTSRSDEAGLASVAPTVQIPNTTSASDPGKAMSPSTCSNPAALGISRTVQIDTTGGPGFGLSQYHDFDFLQPNEVVLTFDDGPWPVNTRAVLAALSAECVKAVFFPIGKHATWHPGIMKEVVAQGHTVGSHTWSHVNLAKKSPQEAKDEIEKGFSAIAVAAGQPMAPFFRFPQLRQTGELKSYLSERNIAAFSIDVDSQDFRIRQPDALVASVMTRLKKAGKGIILMHDFQRTTAIALPEVLQQLKSGGYKVVHVTNKQHVATLPQYDSTFATAQSASTGTPRSTAKVARTVSGEPN
jgi:peptidoglycan/xylan/chitin deacetylase (PgdA/CDA1 family)